MTVPVEIIHGDAIEVLRGMPDASVDAVVTDPPYGLSFLGKRWDYDVPGVDLWREMLRVAKPGAHVVAFSGSRTYHRMAVAIEDAGWEIRDQLMWLYGSGFPKSLDVSQAIDKAAGAVREVGAVRKYAGGHVQRSAESIGYHGCDPVADTRRETLPATEAARRWHGWGTALKPAHEPIVLARKPLAGTVAANVCEHGTGALNVDGCRIESGPDHAAKCASVVGLASRRNAHVYSDVSKAREDSYSPLGRWPANVLHDGSDEATAGMMDAARFFYSAKAGRGERGDDNTHPTVKPVDLMRWLVRLVTPPDGVVLDPFAGSGTTGVAALRENRRAILIEREAEYVEIARRRLAAGSGDDEAVSETLTQRGLFA